MGEEKRRDVFRGHGTWSYTWPIETNCPSAKLQILLRTQQETGVIRRMFRYWAMIWSGPFAVLLDRLHEARLCFETPPATKSIGLPEKPAVLRCGEETYGGGHPFRRLFDPCLMSPQYVRPYIKVYKNDDRDDEAIAKLAMDRQSHAMQSNLKSSSIFRPCTVLGNA